MRPSVLKSTALERWNACDASVSPTVNTATPDVAETIIANQLATSFGMRRPSNTTTIPNTGAQRRGDFNPDLTPDSTCARADDAPEAAPVPELSSRIMAVRNTRFMGRDKKPPWPPPFLSSNTWGTATPKTGVGAAGS